MKYNVSLEFKKRVYTVEADSKASACINALNRIMNISKIESEKLFNEMVHAGMNHSIVEKTYE